MLTQSRMSVAVVAAAAILFGGGCSEIFRRDTGDVEADPRFRQGRKQAVNHNFQAAVASFKKALAANPNNWAAHYELGLIFYNNQDKWAQAICHFEELLRLKPDHHMADQIILYMEACKRQLAKESQQGFVPEAIYSELERLRNENAALIGKVRALQLRLTSVSTNAPTPARAPSPRSAAERASTRPRPNAAASRPAPPSGGARPSGRPEFHVVQSGESFYAIGRLYGVSAQALQNANPGVRPTRLQVGQRIRLPR